MTASLSAPTTPSICFLFLLGFTFVKLLLLPVLFCHIFHTFRIFFLRFVFGYRPFSLLFHCMNKTRKTLGSCRRRGGHLLGMMRPVFEDGVGQDVSDFLNSPCGHQVTGLVKWLKVCILLIMTDFFIKSLVVAHAQFDPCQQWAVCMKPHFPCLCARIWLVSSRCLHALPGRAAESIAIVVVSQNCNSLAALYDRILLNNLYLWATCTWQLQFYHWSTCTRGFLVVAGLFSFFC